MENIIKPQLEQVAELTGITPLSASCEIALMVISDLETTAISSIADAVSAGEVLDRIDQLYKKFGEVRKSTHAALCDWSKVQGIRSCDIGGGKRLVFSQPKTNKFETAEIYQALDVSQELQDILPANPAFRVTAVRQNEKISHLTYEEVSDKVELKPSITDERFLK
jgi:hypothetical protein